MTAYFFVGWFRNCGPVRFLYNLDFALAFDRVKHLNLTDELFRFAKHQANGRLFVNGILGRQKSGIEFRMQLLGDYVSGMAQIRLTLCYEHENGTYSRRYAMFESQVEVLETVYIHPRSDLCSAEYLGQKVLIPCKAEETVINGKCIGLIVDKSIKHPFFFLPRIRSRLASSTENVGQHLLAREPSQPKHTGQPYP